MVFSLFSLIISVDILSALNPQDVTIRNADSTWHILLRGGQMLINHKERKNLFLKEDTYTVFLGDIKRRYTGGFVIFPSQGVLKIINFVDEKDYLYSVVKEEMTSDEVEALKAQAVVARTFLYKNLGRHSYSDMCDLTHCQVYKGIDSIPPSVIKAVNETEGLVLLYKGEIAEVYYHSTCGGRTADPKNIWGIDSVPPYLKSVEDKFCKNSPHYSWRYLFPLDSLRRIFRKDFNYISFVKAYDSTTLSVVIDGDTIKGWQFRQEICRHFGWNTIKSSFFSLKIDGESLIVEGRGLGHRVGLCQWGAIGMAKNGYTFLEILQHFFPGTKVGVPE